MIILNERVRGKRGPEVYQKESRTEKALVTIETHSVPVSLEKHHTQGKARSPPSSLYRALSSPSPSPNPTQEKKRKKKLFLRGGKLCVADRQALDKNFSSQRKVLLRPLFKCVSVNGKSAKDP